MADDFDTIVTGLRRWTKDHDPHVKAAVELLIWHDFWLRRRDFGRAAIGYSGSGEVFIRWADAREFFGTGPRGSSSELAILDLAIALGEDRYRLRIMGHAHARSIGNAVLAALGLGEIVPGAPRG